MKTLLNSLLLILTLMCSSAIAQNKSNYSIEGRVVEASSNNGIGYATVALPQPPLRSSRLVAGLR